MESMGTSTRMHIDADIAGYILCNVCSYSKYEQFDFNVMEKPSFHFERIENDEDMKKGLVAIEVESKNAREGYLQFLGSYESDNIASTMSRTNNSPAPNS